MTEKPTFKLFLDDERWVSNVTWVDLPTGHWQYVRSYFEFVGWIITHGVPSFVSFDHDLGDVEARTGSDAARWLVEYCLEHKVAIPPYQVHSKNPVGEDNIRSIMASGKRVEGSNG